MRESDKILKELGWPPIYMVSREQFSELDGSSLEGDYGISNANYFVFSIRSGLKGKVKRSTIYHEIFHILWPWRKHWWIECAAERMARGGGRGYWSTKFRKTIEDVPSRSRLLKLARRASNRLKLTKL